MATTTNITSQTNGELAQLYVAYLAGTISKRSFVHRAAHLGVGQGAMVLLAKKLPAAA